jgi:hypothetical protein
MMNTKTLGPEELSAIIHREVVTIKSDVRRRPETLPPRLVIPGSKKLVWLESDVMDWLAKCRTTTRHRIK